MGKMKTLSAFKETEDEDEDEFEGDDGNGCEKESRPAQLAAKAPASLDRGTPGHSFFASNRPRPRSDC
jgi:hypothetical protein